MEVRRGCGEGCGGGKEGVRTVTRRKGNFTRLSSQYTGLLPSAAETATAGTPGALRIEEDREGGDDGLVRRSGAGTGGGGTERDPARVSTVGAFSVLRPLPHISNAT